jgi:hypothetical protein
MRLVVTEKQNAGKRVVGSKAPGSQTFGPERLKAYLAGARIGLDDQRHTDVRPSMDQLQSLLAGEESLRSHSEQPNESPLLPR